MIEKEEMKPGVIVRGRNEKAEPRFDRRIEMWVGSDCYYKTRGANGDFDGNEKMCCASTIMEWPTAS